MTNHRVGKTNTKDPRGWRSGKDYKKYDSTNRLIRRTVKRILQKDPHGGS